MEFRKTLGWVLVGLTTACTAEIGPSEADSEGIEDDLPVLHTEEAPVLSVVDTVCPAWRQVVRRKVTNACLKVVTSNGEWTGTKLFGTTPGEYAKYCTYEFNGTPNEDDVDDLHDEVWVAEAAPDCLVVTPQAGLDEIVNPELRALTIDRYDGLSGGDLHLGATEEERSPIRVAVADTTPPTDPTEPRDDHGLVVANLIESAAHGCSTPETCNVVVDNVLALGRFGPGRTQFDPDKGGFIAFHSELAGALHKTVRDWELSKIQGVFEPRLIINLSVAWLSAFGGDPATSRPGVDAILLALRRASCGDALIIAAAGNEVDDCVDGPMLPADWERLPAPTDFACSNSIGGSRPTPLVGSPPLLYSVGGLDFEDAAVSVSRNGGRPRLAAIADHVVGDVDYSARTGTSMAAALVSATAALAWSYDADRSSHEIAELMYDSGVLTGEYADYGPSGSGEEIRRVTACGTLQALCATPGTCPQEFAQSLACAVTPESTDALEAAIASATPATDTDIQFTMGTQCPGYCNEPSRKLYAQGESATCETLPGLARVDYLVAPQPTNPACPTCNWLTSGNPVDANYGVWVNAALAEKYEWLTDTRVIVEVTLANGGRADYHFDPNLSLSTQRLELLPPPTSPIIAATISIHFSELPDPVSGDLLPQVIQ
jgi:hypothetical protein